MLTVLRERWRGFSKTHEKVNKAEVTGVPLLTAPERTTLLFCPGIATEEVLGIANTRENRILR